MNAANDDFEGPLPATRKPKRAPKSSPYEPPPETWSDTLTDWAATAFVIGGVFILAWGAGWV